MQPEVGHTVLAEFEQKQIPEIWINPGAESDQLVPPKQMEALARGLAGPVELHLLPSLYGHDMFLKDTDSVSALVAPFLGEAP